jgi:hypothetical protein
MESIIRLMAPLIAVCMVAIHAYVPPEVKAYGFAARVFMILLAGITSRVHFVIPTASRHIEASGFLWAPLLFSFKWPSAVYALDILAWDWFFVPSFRFAVPVFKTGGGQCCEFS